MALKYGANGVKGAEPSFTQHLATNKGQAELRAFVHRVDARVQRDWNRLDTHLKGGALRNARACVCHPSGEKLDMHLSFSRATHVW